MGKGIVVLILTFVSCSITLVNAAEVELDSRSVDASALLGENVRAKIVYSSRNELANQINLGGVQLLVNDYAYFPVISIAAYQDEALGTAICKLFGFGNGFLGPAMALKNINSFSMNANGEITSLVNTAADGNTQDRHVAVTSNVICGRY